MQKIKLKSKFERRIDRLKALRGRLIAEERHHDATIIQEALLSMAASINLNKRLHRELMVAEMPNKTNGE